MRVWERVPRAAIILRLRIMQGMVSKKIEPWQKNIMGLVVILVCKLGAMSLKSSILSKKG